MFDKKHLFKLIIQPDISALELKHKILEKYNELNPEKPLTLDKFRIRNPKIDDLGEVINDGDIMENYYLYDEKEIYVQEIIPERNFESINSLNPNNVYHVIVREWNPDTWKLGPVYEVKIDKMI